MGVGWEGFCNKIPKSSLCLIFTSVDLLHLSEGKVTVGDHARFPHPVNGDHVGFLHAVTATMLVSTILTFQTHCQGFELYFFMF